MKRLLSRPTDSPAYAWVVVGTFITNYSLIEYLGAGGRW